MASMEDTVTVGFTSLRPTEMKTPQNAPGDIRRHTADSIDANIADVPEAESQLNVNIAAYFEGAATTGGILRMRLWRAGQGNFTETASRCTRTLGYPQRRTKSTSSAYGSHASRTSLVGWLRLAARISAECSSLLRGRQKRRSTTRAAIAPSELRISASCGPRKFDTVN